MRANLLPEWMRHGGIESRRNAERVDALGADFGQPLRIGDRQASIADRINQLEDGGIGADPQRERQNGGGGKDRSASQHSEGVLRVADGVIQLGGSGPEAYWHARPVGRGKSQRT